MVIQILLIFAKFCIVLQKYYIKPQGAHKTVMILNDINDVLKEIQRYCLNCGLIMFNLQFKYI